MSLCLIDKSPRLCSEESERPEATAKEMPFLGAGLRALGFLDRWTSGRVHKEPIKEEKQSPQPVERGPLAIISLDEVSWHDTLDDCWLVIFDYVYDCTDFMRSHPGGQDMLLEYAGRDASLAFIGTGHSQAAKRLLEKFLIGELPKSERIFRTPDGIKVGDFV